MTKLKFVISMSVVAIAAIVFILDIKGIWTPWKMPKKQTTDNLPIFINNGHVLVSLPKEDIFFSKDFGGEEKLFLHHPSCPCRK